MMPPLTASRDAKLEYLKPTMLKKFIIAILMAGGYCSAQAQNYSFLFTNVDTLYMSGAAPGHLAATGPNATPIVSSNLCEKPLGHFAIASVYQSGKVMAIGHEGMLTNSNVVLYDNLPFLLNAMEWLNSGTKRVTLKAGWIYSGNTGTLQNALINNNYTFNSFNGAITTAALANTDILILGNDWNSNQPYSATELNVLQNFVAGGGGLFIAGLGWSWPGTTATYPMSQAANLFGFTYTKDGISDPYHNINGAPKFYNFHPENTDTLHPHCPSPYFGTSITRGDNLRVLRMAVSTTGEFTQQNGGVNAISNLMQQWLSEINTIYGREYCVRFELIPNNNALVFPNPATDPWATLPPGSSACNNAGLILDRQATVIDSVVGAANYDISHVIAGSPFGGGCAGSLTTGVSGGFHLGVTRHEMGHQFGQSHVIDNGGNNNYEPKKPGGWTIQGGNDYGYAHAHSYHQLAHFLNSIPNVGLKIPTGNTIPTVDAGPDVYIPVSTPFTIKVAATDPDPNDSLTYVWDNMTRGPQQSIPVPDDSQGALFWRLLPDTASSRTFPMMSDVLANINVNNQEQLPSQARIMDIRVTVNDNHQMLYNGQMVNASGINSDDLQLTVAAAGPFEVTSQDVPGIVYPGGSDQTITWNVNGTDTLPINTQTVSIRLSTDGGYTYPIALVDSTPNTGLALVTLPNITSSSLRIKVAANNSIYFDVNTADFSLVKSNISIPESAADKEVRVYPNPARDFIVIDFPAQGDFSARLFNMNQRLISEHHNTYRLSTADLPHGIYLLELTDLQSSRKVYKKVMIRN
ncbi:MAG: hypothetical protein CMI36_02310 [Owenweeksia sp.]|nr:hypothetical protein [Owenweeksia sp.]MBF97800.1 hypothetical protein [Owenweeksia sp.]HBF19045.1 hypothetical protein [Cryomorphaceae bacterium]HCQ15031.1 hypothetical protein [Cryomorphaceae bacterium]|tara:strand:- start:4252 stop:6663 length:2412 start_codon:yes stop_codon:yes gene_type:complete